MRKAQAPSPPLTMKSHGSVGGVEVADVEGDYRMGVWGLCQFIYFIAFTQAPPSRPSALLSAREGGGVVVASGCSLEQQGMAPRWARAGFRQQARQQSSI